MKQNSPLWFRSAGNQPLGDEPGPGLRDCSEEGRGIGPHIVAMPVAPIDHVVWVQHLALTGAGRRQHPQEVNTKGRRRQLHCLIARRDEQRELAQVSSPVIDNLFDPSRRRFLEEREKLMLSPPRAEFLPKGSGKGWPCAGSSLQRLASPGLSELRTELVW